MPTVEDLGKAIKTKYPGQYDDLDSADLGRRTKLKHPEYTDYTDISQEEPLSIGGTARAFAKQAPSGLAMMGGMLGGIPGAAAGASFGQAIKNIAPSVFGEPGSPGEQVADAGVDTLAQGVLPKVVGNILKYGVKGAAAAFPGATKLPAVKIAQLINRAKGYMMPESDLIETAADNFNTNPNPIPSSYNIPQTSLKELSQVPYNQTGISATKVSPIAKDMLSDVSTVRNAQIATGNPTIVRQIAASDLVTRNYSKAADTINPSAILDEIGKRPDVYEEAFGKPALDTFTDLMKTAQDKGVGKTTDLASWREGRKAFYIGLPFHTLGVLGMPGGYAMGGVASSLVLGVDAMKAIASNPQLGQMILQATKTNAAAPQAGMLSKAIVMGLRGTSLYLQTPDGKKEKVTIGDNGEIQTPR